MRNWPKKRVKAIYELVSYGWENIYIYSLKINETMKIVMMSTTEEEEISMYIHSFL